MRTSAIVTQSNYIPWKGYFDLIAQVDHFVVLDCVQFTKRDWRNRNKIKTLQGSKWLTIPVSSKGRFVQAIDETRISDNRWIKKHRNLICDNYRCSKFFEIEKDWVCDLFEECEHIQLLHEVNLLWINKILSKLNIDTKVINCVDIVSRRELLAMPPSERLAVLTQEVGASRYVTGSAARDYLELDCFDKRKIDVEWADYSNYPPYPQLWGDYDQFVSILDLIFTVGCEKLHEYCKYIPKVAP